MKKTVSYKLLVVLILTLLISSPYIIPKAQAFEITNEVVDEKNDFVLEPGKVELFLNPGESATRAIVVTSRIKKKVKFKVEVEDFIGSHDSRNPVILLGDEKSPYSIKDNITPDTREFTLDFGQRITIPVKVTIPDNAQPGGFYASVLISNVPDDETVNTSQGKARLVSRVGSLMFIRVKGEANEAGHIEDFRIAGESKAVYDKGPFTFQVLFNNTGNVHLVPYGTVNVKNIFGKSVGIVNVDAYFALPNSTRYREVTWTPGFLLGRYKAVLNLNRGYDDIVDTKTIVFWVLPWKILVPLFIGLLFIVLVGVFISKNFELKKKR
jgi:hypothetical protein